MKKTILILIILMIVVFGFNHFFPVSEEDYEHQEQEEDLKIEVLQEGEGEAIQQGDAALVHYTGTLESGEQFDSSWSRGEPLRFILGAGHVIEGWEQGILGMKIGERRKLTIPPELGYGASGVPSGGIPPNAVLIFEVELMGINE